MEKETLIEEKIIWTLEMQQRFIDAIDEPETHGKFATVKSKVVEMKNKLVTWFKSLPTWKKVLLIVATLAALGLLTWWLVSLGAVTSSIPVGEGIAGAGSIYAITDGTATKIGLTSRDVATRAKEVARYAPNSFVYGSVPVDNMLHFERLAHNHFAPLNFDNYLGSREWFDVTPKKAMNYLNKIAA